MEQGGPKNKIEQTSLKKKKKKLNTRMLHRVCKSADGQRCKRMIQRKVPIAVFLHSELSNLLLKSEFQLNRLLTILMKLAVK